MKIIDLSHPVREGVAPYPGGPPPEFIWRSTFESKGRTSSQFCMSTHTGTHVDAPLHFIPDGKSLDKIPLDQICGPAIVIDISQVETQDRVVTIDIFKSRCQNLKPGDIALVYTGLEAELGSQEFATSFKVLDSLSFEWLTSLPIRAFGVDAVSVDKFESPKFINHFIILAAGIPIIEGLTNLKKIINVGRFFFAAAPLNLTNREAAPCRAFAVLDMDCPQTGEL